VNGIQFTEDRVRLGDETWALKTRNSVNQTNSCVIDKKDETVPWSLLAI
jgi:hypothetical protein